MTNKQIKTDEKFEFIFVTVSYRVSFRVAANVQVFMKKGEFGTCQLVTGAWFCSKVELLPTAS